MKPDCILIRYGEIGTKGMNRPVFEKMLMKNIQDCLLRNKMQFSGIERTRGRIIITSSEAEKGCTKLRHVFGIVSVSPAFKEEADMGLLRKAVLARADAEGLMQGRTFRISAKRIDKDIPLSSPEINCDLGRSVQGETGAGVDLSNPDVEIGIDLVEKAAYVYTKKLPGPGGIPVGCSDDVFCLVNDSPGLLAALLMMKRGCRVHLVAHEKADYEIVKKYAYGFRPELAIVKDPADTLTSSDVLVTGETIDTLLEKKNKALRLTPLIAYSQEEIELQLEKFRTI